ncbi:MAG: cupin domain-containing protein [Phycisphaerae bacterium]|nr:cupin domain-containing protein [Phycisphaerae bacterium]
MPVITQSAPRSFSNQKISVEGLVTAESGAAKSSMFLVTYQPKGYVGPHYHDQEQILHCLEGEGLVYFENKPQPLTEGQVAVVPAGVRHAIFNTGQSRFRVAVFNPVVVPTTHWLTKNRRSTFPLPFVHDVFELAKEAAEKNKARAGTGQ